MKGKIIFRTDEDLDEKLRKDAESKNVSKSWVCRDILTKHYQKKKRTAIEKPRQVIDIPDYIDGDKWLAFMEVRQNLKAPNTERAIKGLLNKLDKFYSEGLDVNEIIDESTINGWKGLFAPKGKKSNLQNNISEAMDFINGR